MEDKPKTKTYTEEEVHMMLDKNAQFVADKVMQSYQVMMDRVSMLQNIIEKPNFYPDYMVKFAIDNLWKIINPQDINTENDGDCK